MNFSGISDKSPIGKLLRLPLRLIPPGAKVPVLQGRLRGKTWIVEASIHGCWLGSFEYDKRRVMEKLVKEGSVVFDLGAHVGFFTLLASVLVGPRGQVFAFEPVSRNLFFLKEHLRLNRVANVTVMEVAVSDRSGEVAFDEGQGNSMGHIALSGQIRVRTVTLDELVHKGELPTPDYIKIDIEGAEMLALTGAKATLAASHPTLFLATHGSEVQQECCRFLQSLDYQLRPLEGDTLEQCSEIVATLA